MAEDFELPVPKSPGSSDPAACQVYFPDAEKMPEGLADVGPGKKVIVTLHGTVSSFNCRNYMGGADIEIKPTAVKVTTDDQEITLDDALSAAERTL